MTFEMNSTQAIPEFSMDAASLREVVDQIADDAMNGLEKVTQVLASAPAELHPFLNELRALFGSIGFAADTTSDDVHVDLVEVWGTAAARAENGTLGAVIGDLH